MKRIKLNIVSLLVIFAFGISVGLAQSSCTNCNPCLEGGPCCNIWNACNYNQTFCFDNTGCLGSTVDPNGCDMACTPIDSGVLFLLIGGAAFGGMMIMRRRQEALEVIKN